MATETWYVLVSQLRLMPKKYPIKKVQLVKVALFLIIISCQGKIILRINTCNNFQISSEQ